eukprot:15441060-Alexandrium_andersonii.AAC.1
MASIATPNHARAESPRFGCSLGLRALPSSWLARGPSFGNLNGCPSNFESGARAPQCGTISAIALAAQPGGRGA